MQNFIHDVLIKKKLENENVIRNAIRKRKVKNDIKCSELLKIIAEFVKTYLDFMKTSTRRDVKF